AAIVENSNSAPTVEIDFDSNTFIELATGRATSGELRKKIKLSGDTALGELVVGALNMMI
ncbi:MAG TPA: hypothetical protein DD711_05665, partial [Acidimicrobium sp.]|nr:hypothetical protein [Acidimicrobium sp.]